MSESLPSSYFDRVYQDDPDPWGFETRPYERAKYDRTLAALPRERYEDALEVGCSIGVLTRRLAGRCAHLTATDVAEAPLGRAKERCRDLLHVRFERVGLQDDALPRGPFGLVVLSEVGYYLSENDLRAARSRLLERLQPGGHLLLVHWTPYVEDYPITGDRVHGVFLEASGEGGPLQRLQGERHGDDEAGYRLDLFERV